MPQADYQSYLHKEICTRMFAVIFFFKILLFNICSEASKDGVQAPCQQWAWTSACLWPTLTSRGRHQNKEGWWGHLRRASLPGRWRPRPLCRRKSPSEHDLWHLAGRRCCSQRCRSEEEEGERSDDFVVEDENMVAWKCKRENTTNQP